MNTPMALHRKIAAARERFPGHVIIFRNGDFCEMFGPDATTAHDELGCVITTMADFPMAGFPWQLAPRNAEILRRCGHPVAVVDLEEP